MITFNGLFEAAVSINALSAMLPSDYQSNKYCTFIKSTSLLCSLALISLLVIFIWVSHVAVQLHKLEWIHKPDLFIVIRLLTLQGDYSYALFKLTVYWTYCELLESCLFLWIPITPKLQPHSLSYLNQAILIILMMHISKEIERRKTHKWMAVE